MKIEALGSNVVIKATRENSGIILITTGEHHEKADFLNSKTEVISAGPDCTRVKVGDRIIMPPTKAVRLDDNYLKTLGEDPETVMLVIGDEKDALAVIS